MDWTAEIAAAAARIGAHVQRTPVMTSRGFGLDHPVDFKLEHMQHAGSFKARGAFNTLLSREVPESGCIAVSGGNHGAAVAYAGARLGHRVEVFVPDIASPEKIALIERLGGTVRRVAGDIDTVFAVAAARAAETGALEVHPYDAVPTLAGQGTAMMEWEEQGLEADTVLIAVGGGGLIGGALGWLGDRRRVVAVEPEGCATLARALETGPGTTIAPGGVAASALGARSIGGLGYELVRRHGARPVLVEDAAISAAQRALWQERRILVEPGGATALAALTSGAYRPAKRERVAVLLCGGNVSPDPFA